MVGTGDFPPVPADQATAQVPVKKGSTMSRRTFLLKAAGLGVAATGSAILLDACAPAPPSQSAKEGQAAAVTPTVESILRLQPPFTVREIMGRNPDQTKKMAALYGQIELDPNDLIWEIPAPPPGKALDVGFHKINPVGVAAPKSPKGGDVVGLHIIIQNRSDTKSTAIKDKPQNVNVPLVYRVKGGQDSFEPAVATYEENTGLGKWTEVEIPKGSGKKLPAVAVFGLTPDRKMLLYVPKRLLENNKIPPTANMADLSLNITEPEFSATDKGPIQIKPFVPTPSPAGR